MCYWFGAPQPPIPKYKWEFYYQGSSIASKPTQKYNFTGTEEEFNQHKKLFTGEFFILSQILQE